MNAAPRETARPRFRHGAAFLGAALVALLSHACSPPAGPGSAAGADAAVYSYSPAQPVFPLDFGTAASRSFRITGAAGKSVCLVRVNLGQTALPASASGGVSGSAAGPGASSIRAADDGAGPSGTEAPAPDGMPIRLEFPPAAEWNARPALRGGSRGGSPLPALSVAYGANPALIPGVSTRDFWVPKASGAWTQVSATLRAVGQFCYVWVPDAYFAVQSASATDNRLTGTQIAALAARFDGSAARAFSDGIYRQMTNLFGYEPGGGPDGQGGRDGDQHVGILLYDIDFDYSSSQSSGVFGYFWSKDDLTNGSLAASGSSVKSNEAELFYLDAHFMDRYPGVMFSTLAHEFQHMIHYNQKNYLNPSFDANGLPAASSPWFNEMCSLVAEDLLASLLGTSDEDGPAGRLSEFNCHYAETGVTGWLSGTSVLKSYACAYAFGAYLLRNYGGAPLFASIVTCNSVDAPAIDAALAANGFPGESFRTVLARFGEALVFGDRPAGSTVRTLKQAGDWTVNGLDYHAKPLDLGAFPQFNVDLRSWVYASGVAVRGPRIHGLASTPDLPACGLLLQSGGAWQNLADGLAVSIDRPLSPDVRLFLMVR